ncbi:hypothetical protein [Arthrobacter cupressi]|uniref:Uncharacterized protein n=1 Tax=Arthrobacter cupressi TaxID=1045773 RepID=A0A1G8HTX3_9MICC|nr:hypothetical protein [Arthrobacter cupressi]NYD78808.1 hypothetical protein [Arthrobacter cupressi]SDI10125.1 hypothetical protein SAMN05216555_10132 [Arthrobacter cupressi]
MESTENRAAGYTPWLLGPVATGTGLLAHLASGGDLPWPPALLAFAALLSMCASLLSRLRLPVWALLLLCGVTQQALHLAFVLFSGIVPGQGSSQHSHVLGLPLVQGAAQSTAGHVQEVMLVFHVAAALLTALLMAKAGSRFPRRPAPGWGRVRQSARDRRR